MSAPREKLSTRRNLKPDPITTQIIRHALSSAAKEMKRAVIRTSFSPIVYEMMDFAVVIYDRQIRLLGQAPTLPIFMGTMGACIESAVAAVGGENSIEPGDVIIYNMPYGTGSHAQDAAVVMPVFMPRSGELVGYSAAKAHWLDIGAIAPYATNTTDVYQEGVVIPGVKLYKAGLRNDDVYRFVLANCRFKKAVEGDINAEVAGCHVGARELVRIIERFGPEAFTTHVEDMFEHGEHVVREFIRTIPDGTYHATCHMDNNGIDDRPIQFEITVVIEHDSIRVDLSNAPDAQPGPTNCPRPSTVSGARVMLAMLAGNAGETPNEGHFRPLEVVTRPGSMFEPIDPQPCYLYSWPLFSAMEGMQEALATATDGKVPSGSAADLCGVLFYGTRAGEPFFGGSALPTGQGARAHADGETQFIMGEANAQTQSPELQEAKLPVRFERWEYAPDTGGAGKYRGGSGWECSFRALQDMNIISAMERTKVPGWAQKGGFPGAPNRFEIEFPDGHTESILKVTGRCIPAGSVLRIHCGGGGGYGPPVERDTAAVRRDLLHEIITEHHARKFYPQLYSS